MKKIIDLITEEDFRELRTILDKLKNGYLVATVKQAMPNQDDFNFIDIQQFTCEAKPIFQINNGCFYVNLPNLKRNDVPRLKTLFATVLQRGTNNFPKPNDYFLTFDFVYHEEEAGVAYSLSAIFPIFESREGENNLMFVFPLEEVRCSIDKISMYEVEYETQLREESGNTVYTQFIDDDDE